jgi:hypothetical protein
MVTGNGLKDIQSAQRAVGDPISLEPTLDALTAVLSIGKKP